MSAILDKSPWDSDEYSLYLLFLGASFSKFTCISLPHPPPPSPSYTMLKLGYTCLALFVGLREGMAMRIENSPTNANESQDFCPSS